METLDSTILERLVNEGKSGLHDDRIIGQVLLYAASKMRDADVYRHENGFVKVTLGIYSHLQIRIHVWDQNSSIGLSSIHSHRHPIASRIVIGALEETRWLQHSTGKHFNRYDFFPGRPGQMELVEGGIIRLCPAPAEARQAGEVYTIPVEEFHAVQPLEIPTITVFTQDLRVRSEGAVASMTRPRNLKRPNPMKVGERAILQRLIIDHS